MNSSPLRLPLLLGLAAVVVSLAFAAFTGHMWEDYFITFRASLNLATGNGLVFQPGERVHTFTSPIGTLLPALFALGGGEDVAIRALWLLRIASALTLGGALWLALRAMQRDGLVTTAIVAIGVEGDDLGVTDAGAVRSGFELGCATVRGIELAKEWANRPANHATPTLLADAARQLAKKSHLSAEILGPAEVEALGMGAFMAVSQGSEQPLRFIVLKYQGAHKSVAPVVLVGKGVTFDTGGISIKPAAEMDEMKFDMGGAASVLGTFAALAELQPTINVVGLIPSCENMPDGMAVKPGDVVTSMSGQTIEILNTDAEGRLILCDALTYAARFKPRAVVDIATLTGACVIALGAVRSGLFSADDALAQALQTAGEAALDPCWRMPLDDEYAEGLKSNFADMGNVAGRAAGAVTAAKFLQKFTGELAWAHLDIAGTAWKSGAAKGATGRPVPLLVHYLLGQAEQAKAPKKTARRKA